MTQFLKDNGALKFHVLTKIRMMAMRNTALLILILLLSQPGLQAQEEFVLGKSANTLQQGKAIFSGEYSVFAFENIRSRRFGLDISYGLTDRLQLMLRGSVSDFPNASFEFETGGLTVLYRMLDANLKGKTWRIAAFAQTGVISNLSQSPADINFEGNNSGFALGMVANRNIESSTLAFSTAYARISMPQFNSGLLNGYAILYTASWRKKLNIQLEAAQLDWAFIAELVGQFNTEMTKIGNRFFNKGSYLDGLGALQVTYANQYRVELGLQTQLTGNIIRFTDSLYHIRLKYLL